MKAYKPLLYHMVICEVSVKFSGPNRKCKIMIEALTIYPDVVCIPTNEVCI